MARLIILVWAILIGRDSAFRMKLRPKSLDSGQNQRKLPPANRMEEKIIAQATFTSRMAAALIDMTLLPILLALFSSFPIYLAESLLNARLIHNMPRSGLVFLDPIFLWPLPPILVLFPVFYSTFFVARSGGTPGMMMLKIVLVRPSLEKVSYLRAVVRYLPRG
jgi:uncharacterized RDD family membrane protein YckC